MSEILEVSPFASRFVDVEPSGVLGLKIGVGSCGIYKHKNDLLLCCFEDERGSQAVASVAGVFTRSKFAAWPVRYCAKSLGTGKMRFLVVNSGNSLALTGNLGRDVVEDVIGGVADLCQCDKEKVFYCATGVTGTPLDSGLIVGRLPDVISSVRSSDSKLFVEACRAIETTDTFRKTASAKAVIGGKEVSITGIAKGSGMIEPNMATMLAYIFTDATIPSQYLQDILNDAVRTSFNAITVDGDTSTNDTVLLVATNYIDTEVGDARDLTDFKKKVSQLAVELARAVVMDGEGVSRILTVNVRGARTEDEAIVIGKAIGNSPLVKTAIAGGDANWGRIAVAIGNTSVACDRDNFKISIGGVLVSVGAARVREYDELEVDKRVKEPEVVIDVDLCSGVCRGTVWASDLTAKYVAINADYRT